MIRLQINENLTEDDALAHMLAHLMSHSYIAARRAADGGSSMAQSLASFMDKTLTAHSNDPAVRANIVAEAAKLALLKYELPEDLHNKA